jgi:hypothetical protein
MFLAVSSKQNTKMKTLSAKVPHTATSGEKSVLKQRPNSSPIPSPKVTMSSPHQSPSGSMAQRRLNESRKAPPPIVPPNTVSHPQQTGYSALFSASGSPSPTLEKPQELIHALQAHPLFKDTKQELIEQLCHMRYYRPGDSIIKYGELGKAMFLVIKVKSV